MMSEENYLLPIKKIIPNTPNIYNKDIRGYSFNVFEKTLEITAHKKIKRSESDIS